MILRLRRTLARLADPDRGLLLPVFGFPVRVHPTFWLVAVVVALQSREHPAFLVVPALLGSILVHELGHAFAASHWGTVYRITVHGGGGLTEWRVLGTPCWRKTVAVSLAGPMAGFLLAASAWAAQTLLLSVPWLWIAASGLCWLNLAWSLFNLLPVYPLDGGQALRTVLLHRYPSTGELAAAIVSLAATGPAVVLAITSDQPWAILVLGLCAVQNGTTTATLLAKRPRSGWRSLDARDRVRDRY